MPVVSDFELVTMMIRHSRPEFTCQHGRVVSSPDVLGQRHGLYRTLHLRHRYHCNSIVAVIVIIPVMISVAPFGSLPNQTIAAPVNCVLTIVFKSPVLTTRGNILIMIVV